jgi:hypothetical protein
VTLLANGVLVGQPTGLPSVTPSVTGAVTVGAGGVVMPTGWYAGEAALTVGSAVFQAGSVYVVKVTTWKGPAAPNTGGSSDFAAPVPPTTNDFLRVTTGALSFDPGTTFRIESFWSSFVPGASYSYRVAQRPGQDLSGLYIGDPARFTSATLKADSIWISGDSAGTVYLNLVNVTPIPEPELLLAAAAAGLGVVRLLRRRNGAAGPGAGAHP